MRIDLHCHSKYSKRPSLWLMQKIGCPESFTEPLELYHTARRRGMTAVTITDHNVIDACLEIAHLPDTLVGCEYTAYFPEDRCKVHVLAYGMSEEQHGDLCRARENLYDFAGYLRREKIPHTCAHPLYGPNGRLTLEHIEQLILLFRNWECNGDVHPEMNAALRKLLAGLTPKVIADLAAKHRMEPFFDKPWEKHLTAGSDDHSSLTLAAAYTEVRNARDFNEFWQGVNEGRAQIQCRATSPKAYARNVYSIAYQFHKSKFRLDRYVQKDVFLSFLDRTLRASCRKEPKLSRFYLLLSRRWRARASANGGASLLDTARAEAERLIQNDSELRNIVRGTLDNDVDKAWYEFVNRVSNKVLAELGGHVIDRFAGGRLFDLFHSLGSAAGLYTLSAPYYVACSILAKQRRFGHLVLNSLGKGRRTRHVSAQAPRLAHFTDTFREVNGVALTLQQQLVTARELGKDYSVITCRPEAGPADDGLVCYRPVGTCAVPSYPELQLFMPPFLQMLLDCYDQAFTHIKVATPGPVGLAALGVARILQLPITGTYHTAFPQYTKALTGDAYMEELSWKFMIWFYAQLDAVFVPSAATGEELIARGLAPGKVVTYPRGVDIERFHPRKRPHRFGSHCNSPGNMPTLLYVGRVSKEKNLHILSLAYRELLARGYDARLVVVGDGPYREEMETALDGTPALFTGYLDGEDLAGVYASSELFIFPSTTDTFGNVVLEAQASGIPVVVTDQGGPRENVIPSETGLIVPGDSVGGLVEAVAALLEDPVRRAAMGRAARRYMEGRSFQQAFEKLWAMAVGEDTTPLDRTEPEPVLRCHAESPAMAF